MKPSSGKHADVCADSHDVIAPEGGGFVVLLVQIKTDVCMCLTDLNVHPAVGMFVGVCAFLTVCVYTSYKCVWSIVSVYRLSATIMVSCLRFCCVYFLLSLSVTHHKPYV